MVTPLGIKPTHEMSLTQEPWRSEIGGRRAAHVASARTIWIERAATMSFVLLGDTTSNERTHPPLKHGAFDTGCC